MLSSIISGSPPRCAVIAERQGTPGARAHLPVSGELFKMMTGVSLVHVPYRGAGPAFVDLLEDQLAMLLEYAEASFECMEHRFRQLRGLACVKRVLQEYALANDVGLQFGDVPVGLVKMLLFPSAIHGFAPTARHSSGLNRRTTVGRAPAPGQ